MTPSKARAPSNTLLPSHNACVRGPIIPTLPSCQAPLKKVQVSDTSVMICLELGLSTCQPMDRACSATCQLSCRHRPETRGQFPPLLKHVRIQWWIQHQGRDRGPALRVAPSVRRPGGGPERSEGIAVSQKEAKAGSIFATRFRSNSWRKMRSGRSWLRLLIDARWCQRPSISGPIDESRLPCPQSLTSVSRELSNALRLAAAFDWSRGHLQPGLRRRAGSMLSVI